MYLSGQHPIDVYLVSQSEGELTEPTPGAIEPEQLLPEPFLPEQLLPQQLLPEPPLNGNQPEALFDIGPAEDLLKPEFSDYFSLFSGAPEELGGITDLL